MVEAPSGAVRGNVRLMFRARLSELEVLDLVGEAEDIREELFNRAEPKLSEAGDLVVGAIKANLSRRRGTKRTASPPGEPPELDELRDSWKKGRLRRTRNSIRQEYESDHPGAGLHEFGGTVTQNGRTRRYLPRPYVRPAEEQTEKAIEALLEDL
jgi:hypothetical protein